MANEDEPNRSGGTTSFEEEAPFRVTSNGLDLTFYPAGEDRRRALLEMVGNARRSLKLCFYIFMEDDVGTSLRDALIDAARRGVSIKVILDRFGAETSEEFLRPLREAGADCCYFSEKWTHRYLVRNHQKLLVADDESGMFGGFNIEDDYFAPPQENGWNDLAIAMRGDAVEGLVDWFDKLDRWTAKPTGNFRAIRRTVRDWEWDGEGWCWLVGGPTRGLSSWAAKVSKDVASAERLDMFMAYFSPPKKILKRIGRIAKEGEARLLMAGKSDNAATLGATRSLYSYLLHKGAKIWEFEPCKLHTKLLVVDDIVYLGSANFDMRSLYVNLELMLRVEDAALADRMREYMERHIAASKEITPQYHARQATLLNRIRWNLGWLLVSVIDYTVSRRLNI
ncbi:cardiolipin synthase B [Altererythrobacter aurantiacus]|uniref:Phospholipase D n=1 Tax=Parapontixanthobacter aurantiacus TaxID=1463599 RepID=A0A844ZHA3_9SPHN|nr:phosphatidylserine/phosphatidylglycerophosphate/cardiolipin synthase family protein [Parapontixanthobacter aurantiacus]MXO86360.1 cardiolipin synthase B [Parapontixanthobacter aurantiacus]